MSRKVKKEGDAMADLLVALALLTFAGVAGLDMMHSLIRLQSQYCLV